MKAGGLKDENTKINKTMAGKIMEFECGFINRHRFPQMGNKNRNFRQSFPYVSLNDIPVVRQQK